VLLAKVAALEGKVVASELRDGLAKKIAVVEEHYRMGKGRIVVEVTLTVSRLAGWQRSLHREPLASNVREALDVAQLAESFVGALALGIGRVRECLRRRIHLLEQKGRHDGEVCGDVQSLVGVLEKNDTLGRALGEVGASVSGKGVDEVRDVILAGQPLNRALSTSYMFNSPYKYDRVVSILGELMAAEDTRQLLLHLPLVRMHINVVLRRGVVEPGSTHDDEVQFRLESQSD